MVSSLDDLCLDKAIEGIIDTALEAGHTVDVRLVTDRLLVDFKWLRLDKQAVYRRVAAECTKRPGLACVLEKAG